MWGNKKKNTKDFSKEMNPVSQRQVMIPLMDRGPVPIQQKLAALDRNLSHPTQEKLERLNDRSYITKQKKQSRLQQFCNNLDKKYVVFSPDGRFFLIWNILLIGAILYNFFQLPISIFLTQRVYNDQFSSAVWVLINVLFLLVLFADMAVVRWNLAFYQYGELVTRRYSIVKNYLKFQVYLDMVSFIVLLIYISSNYRDLVYLKLLFYLKVYSLYKVDKSLINYLELHKVLYLFYIFFRITFILLFIVIWISTVYFAIDYYYYLQQGEYYLNSQLWLTDTLSGVDFIQDIAWPYWLLYAAYWASQITATIGYGVGTPRNPITVAYCCFVIVLMTVVFALFINTIWSIISQIQESSIQYYESWSSLNKILKEKEISSQLNIRVSQYFHQVWKYNDTKKNNTISNQLSQDLKKQLMNLSHLHIFHDIPLFEKWEEKYHDQWIGFKMKVFDLVGNQELAEGEMLKVGEESGKENVLYCVLKGRIKLKVKVCDKEEQILYKVNQRFGFEEFFMQKPITYTAQADCFTRIAKISRKRFISCLKQFPTMYFDFIQQVQKMNFSSDRSLLGLKCWFCNQTHTPFRCPTKTSWRETLIRKDPVSINQKKTLSTLDKTQSQSRKTYRSYVRSDKVYNLKLASPIEIDQILHHQTTNHNKSLIYLDQKSKFNF